MNQKLQQLLDSIQQSAHLSDDEKNALAKKLKEVDKEIEITSFKLDRTEKVKRTTAILLEETIEELEQKRKAVEAQNRELEIESSLERVRTVALSMNKPDDMLLVCRIISEQMEVLKVKEIRNVQTAIFYKDKGTYMNYEYYVKHNKTFITETTYTNNEIHKAFADKMLSGSGEYMIAHIKGDEVKDWIAYQKTTNVFIDDYLYTASSLNYYWYSLGPVALGISTYEPLKDEETNLFKRFLKVFELSYRRYLDIEKAEAQARESQIQLALERVRARTMAMQKSDELGETVFILFQQFKQLGENPDQATIGIINEEEWVIEYWVTMYGNQTNRVYKFPIDEPNVTNRIYKGWKEQKKSLAIELSGKELFDFATFRESKGGAAYNPEEKKRVINVAFFSKGIINVQSNESRSEESIRLLERFANVFEQTYTRFLDLQKAEAQAREAQIEAALERTRTQSMIMQHSKELEDTLRVFHEQVLLLSIPSAFSFLWLPDETNDRHIFWAAWEEDLPAGQAGKNDSTVFKSKAINYPLDRNEPATAQCLVDWRGNEPIVSYHVPPTGVENYFAAWQELITGVEQLQPKYFSNGLCYVEAFMKYGCFGVMVANDLTEDEKKLLSRFAIEFERTYTRFLDLQKAEAQTREAQIETALERVRSKTMAMHSSADVGETATVMVDELKKLGIETIRCGIGIMHEPGDMELWTIKTDENNKTDVIIGWMDMNIHPLLHGAFESWRNKNESYAYELKDEDLLNYYNAINNYPGYPIRYDTSILPKQIHHNEFHFTEGTLFAFSLQQLTDEQRKIFKRFAGVFGQTYRRYLDLKKAEAQTREAKIEAAMEKVRSRAMAMQKPGELVEVAQLLRKEMNGLGVEELETSSIYIHHEDTQKTECWYAIKDVAHAEKELVSDHMTIELEETWVGKQMLAFYRSDKKQISITMQGANRKEWINYCADHSKVLVGYYGDDIPDRTYHLYKFSNGYMGAASPGDISAESWDLLQRATSVFSLAYTRFNDLQQAEAQAREARIEASLERVRSRTLAMQKSDELAEAAAVVFRQLISLGIEPNRLYITIIKDESGDMEFWITDEDGTRVGNKFSGNAHRNISFQKMYEGWAAHKKSITIDMQGDELVNYFQHLNELGVPFKLGLTQKRRIQNIAYFGKGFIGMASPDEQPEETISLLERFAAVFNLTYTRFNDLQVAEAHAVQAEEDLIKLQTEKKRAEEALTELRETQKQLIQSEKMASLGELTAGIAHEIQNPLNFVNNFSEVNTELIEELKGERHKAEGVRNTQLEDELIGDIEQNMEKIAHHGKRADAIVKGMLQHSRTSSATKEPTDINKLADEYLRLAYHGLRAKDKLFNATLKTNFDGTIGNINIIPQDIGRVILNLISNAFYAVVEKKNNNTSDYEPTVTVATRYISSPLGGRRAEIKVSDNGGGIDSAIINKIFQPFFTTKPTGQGTGLGLSLAYDIVKAHGGELKVETKEGEGSEFIIQLPIV